MGVVVGLDPDPAAVHLPLRDRHADHRRDPPRGAEQGAEAGHVVDAEVEQRPAPRRVEPLVPPRAGPAVARTRGEEVADPAAAHGAVDCAERRAEKGVRRAHEEARRRPRQVEELRRLLQRGGHRLLDEHVPAGLERRLRERAVLVHARQHEHHVDVVRADDLVGTAQAGIDVVVRRRATALRVVDVVDGARRARDRRRASRSIMPRYGPAKTLPQPITPSPRLMRCVSRPGSTPPSRRAGRRRARARARAAARAPAAEGNVDTAASRRSTVLAGGRSQNRRAPAGADLPPPRRGADPSSGGRKAERERSGPQRHHRRGRPFPGLDALGRDARDLLQQQRSLERRGPRGAAPEDDRRLGVDLSQLVDPRPGVRRWCARADPAGRGARRPEWRRR